jgi:hypothetical protein
MRCLASLLLAAIASIWCSLVQAETDSLQSLPGEWHQVVSNAGTCADCRVVVEISGQDFVVKASNGWSAIVRPSLQGKVYAAGKGSWEPKVGGGYGGRAFHLNLGLLDDKLLMLMTVPGSNGKLRNIKAVFRKESASGETF